MHADFSNDLLAAFIAGEGACAPGFPITGSPDRQITRSNR
jgi:hypothetical protein